MIVSPTIRHTLPGIVTLRANEAGPIDNQTKRKLTDGRRKPLRFLACGVVLTAYAYAVNAALVELLQLPALIAYAIVMVTQMIFGLLLNRFVVYDHGGKSLRRLAGEYWLASIALRGANWCLYFALVHWVSLHYLLAQTICIAVFLCLKFVLFRKIFESAPAARDDS